MGGHPEELAEQSPARRSRISGRTHIPDVGIGKEVTGYARNRTRRRGDALRRRGRTLHIAILPKPSSQTHLPGHAS